jgi:hypothetical protein
LSHKTVSGSRGADPDIPLEQSSNCKFCARKVDAMMATPCRASTRARPHAMALPFARSPLYLVSLSCGFGISAWLEALSGFKFAEVDAHNSRRSIRSCKELEEFLGRIRRFAACTDPGGKFGQAVLVSETRHALCSKSSHAFSPTTWCCRPRVTVESACAASHSPMLHRLHSSTASASSYPRACGSPITSCRLWLPAPDLARTKM